MKKTIDKYLKGMASKEEQHSLLSYLRESDAHREVFKNQKEVWKADADQMISLATWKAWKKVDRQTQPDIKKRIIWLKAALSIASILIVSIGVGTMVLMDGFKNQLVTVQTRQGQTSEVMLPDSSKVYLNANSSITYNALLFRFNREVEMKGEAFFDVRKKASHRFLLNVDDVNVQVLGTRFNVSAYETDPDIDIVLEEGLIEISLDRNSAFRQLLRPGQKAAINRASQSMALTHVKPEDYSAWKDGVLYFKDNKLRDFFNQLGRRYGVVFQLEDNELLHDMSINLTIRNDRLEEVLQVVQLTLPVKITTEQDAFNVQLDKKRYELIKR